MKRSKNFEYILFDDRKLMLYGIPIGALLAPLLFLTISFKEYVAKIPYIFMESLIYAVVIWWTLRYLVIQLRKRFPSIEQTHERLFYSIGGSIIVTFLSCKLISFGEQCFNLLFNTQDLFVPEFIIAFLAVSTISLSVLVLYEAFYFFYKFKAAVKEKEEVKTAHVQTQLDNLRNQINPHFLFNSLNTLMNLIPKDEQKAMNYLDKLSKFYRYSVGKKDNVTVPLQTELTNIKIYAELLKERFGDNISIDIRNGVTNEVHILPMTLQLLIENAVKHNIVSKNKPLDIDVFVDNHGEYIHVKNNLQKKIQSVQSTGMGLKNIRDRFTYFTDKLMECHETKDSFEVKIPLLRKLVLE